MFRFPLKQTFLDYFALDGIDNTASSSMISKFIYQELQKCGNPCEKGMEIWEKFVETNDDFFDMPSEWLTKKRLDTYKDQIKNSKNPAEISTVFGCIGVSPFCNRY